MDVTGARGGVQAVEEGEAAPLVPAASWEELWNVTPSLRVLRRCSDQLELTGGLGEGVVLRGGSERGGEAIGGRGRG